MDVREYRAAGGIVVDAAGRALTIQRLVWRDGDLRLEIRLPKGHVEAGETDEQAALREVCEETGYCGTTVRADLGTALSEFDTNGRHVRRTEHYFLMDLTDPRRSEAQFDHANSEEALFRPLWTSGLPEAEALLTFESERAFVRRALAESLKSNS